MAETTDPDAAPMHHEIKERFSTAQVALAGFLGTAAIVVGLVLGLVLVNN
ncbi:MAG: hypothetical protein IT304_05930 [Dehalococcoidia bacterium]|nr:hypothetical protein [Dehalococcoidia bacterium]